MSLLNDPALGLRPFSRKPHRAERVRILAASDFASAFGIPDGVEGEVRDRFTREGRDVLGLWIEGVGYLSGVPASEVAAVE